MLKFRSVLGAKILILVLLSLFTGAAVPVAALAQGQPALPSQALPGLTAKEKAQAAALAAQVLKVIKSMSRHTSERRFEGVIFGLTAGKPCPVVKAALASVMATPGLPKTAVAAAAQVSKSCGPTRALGQGNDNAEAPGFAGGGGGPGYSQ